MHDPNGTNRYFIITNGGYIMTNDKKMSQMEFTIDEMIYSSSKAGSILQDPGQRITVYYVTKNGKDYWGAEEGFVDGRERNHTF